jgi:hypothetical protein
MFYYLKHGQHNDALPDIYIDTGLWWYNIARIPFCMKQYFVKPYIAITPYPTITQN